jgi:hypothetical protein
MKKLGIAGWFISMLLLITLVQCQKKETNDQGNADSQTSTEKQESVDREKSIFDEEGNEGYVKRLGDKYEELRDGVKLSIFYDPRDDFFKGTVENTLNQPVCGVKLNVQLINGTELGPTAPFDLEIGHGSSIVLHARDLPFTEWRAKIQTTPCK